MLIYPNWHWVAYTARRQTPRARTLDGWRKFRVWSENLPSSTQQVFPWGFCVGRVSVSRVKIHKASRQSSGAEPQQVEAITESSTDPGSWLAGTHVFLILKILETSPTLHATSPDHDRPCHRGKSPEGTKLAFTANSRERARCLDFGAANCANYAARDLHGDSSTKKTSCGVNPGLWFD